VFRVGDKSASYVPFGRDNVKIIYLPACYYRLVAVLVISLEPVLTPPEELAGLLLVLRLRLLHSRLAHLLLGAD
jgi:hypothetical protein